MNNFGRFSLWRKSFLLYLGRRGADPYNPVRYVAGVYGWLPCVKGADAIGG